MALFAPSAGMTLARRGTVEPPSAGVGDDETLMHGASTVPTTNLKNAIEPVSWKPVSTGMVFGTDTSRQLSPMMTLNGSACADQEVASTFGKSSTFDEVLPSSSGAGWL